MPFLSNKSAQVTSWDQITFLACTSLTASANTKFQGKECKWIMSKSKPVTECLSMDAQAHCGCTASEYLQNSRAWQCSGTQHKRTDLSALPRKIKYKESSKNTLGCISTAGVLMFTPEYCSNKKKGQPEFIHASTDEGRWNQREVRVKYVSVFLPPKRGPFLKEGSLSFELQKPFLWSESQAGAAKEPIVCLLPLRWPLLCPPPLPSLIFASAGRSEDPSSLQSPIKATFFTF